MNNAPAPRSSKLKEAKKAGLAGEPLAPDEAEAVAQAMADFGKVPQVVFRDTADGRVGLTFDHQNELAGGALLMAALGITDSHFFDALLVQSANASRKKGEARSADVNFTLAVMRDITPRDHVERLLAQQMATIHLATMTMAQRLGSANSIEQQSAANNALNKLARTFAAQVDALKRYRSTGTQKVVVEHVTVNAGGQAIVGAVSTGTPANDAVHLTSVPLQVLAEPQVPSPAPGGGRVQREKAASTS
jgi:hypothetical protein